MTPNYLLILFCSIFSFFCSLIKQLYDAHYCPKNFYTFIMDVILSAVCGVIIALILTGYIDNELTIIGISGLGGMVGLSGLKSLIKFQLGKKIQIQLIDSENDQADIFSSLTENKENK